MTTIYGRRKSAQSNYKCHLAIHLYEHMCCSLLMSKVLFIKPQISGYELRNIEFDNQISNING